MKLGRGLHRHGLGEVIVPGQDSSIYVALVNDKILVASPGKDYVVDALEQHRSKKKASLKNKAFQSLVENLDPKQTVSFAILGKSLAAAVGDTLPAGFTDSLKKIEAIGGGLTVTNEVKLDVLVSSKDGPSADSFRTTLDKGVKLGMVGLALLTEGRKELRGTAGGGENGQGRRQGQGGGRVRPADRRRAERLLREGRVMRAALARLCRGSHRGRSRLRGVDSVWNWTKGNY